MTTAPRNSTVEQVRVPGGCLVRLGGIIDQTFDAAAFSSAADGVLVIDLDGVHRITSAGVRQWLAALARAKRSWLGFVRCRPAMVAQFNLADGFAAGGEVLSLYLPYVCPKTGKTFEQLIDVAPSYRALREFRVPEQACPEGDGPAELDDVPEAYLAWLSTQPLPSPPPLVAQLLGAAAGHVRPSSLRIAKEVQGESTGFWLTGPLTDRSSFKRLADGVDGTVLLAFDQVSSASAPGRSLLLGFMRELKGTLHLQQAPLDIALAIALDRELAARSCLLSLRVPATCAKDGVFTAYLSAQALKESEDASRLEVLCPSCVSCNRIDLTPQALDALRTLNTRETPPWVRQLDAAHAMSAALSSTPDARARPGAARQVLGRYQLVRRLGAGGMAEVSLARHSSLGGFERAVVVKQILPGLARDEKFVGMFLTEARLAASLSHPNVVQVFDVGEDGGEYFIVMEYVRGCDLNTLLRASERLGRPVPQGIAARIAADVCAALGAAHEATDAAGKSARIVHRDVSPHNVLVSLDGHVKLTDFGIAKASDDVTTTPTALLKGKAAYLAPELVAGGRSSTDPRIDLFAAGLVFFQMLTLEHPFRRATEIETFSAIRQEDAGPPSARVKGITPAADAICARALAKDPALRFQSAAQMREKLESLCIAGSRVVGSRDVATWVSTLPGAVPLTEQPVDIDLDLSTSTLDHGPAT